MQSHNVKKIETGEKRPRDFNRKLRIYQIIDTMFFELDKSKRKFITMIIVSSIIIVLNLSIFILGDNTLPINPEGFVSFSSTLVLITSLVFGGSLIVRDFEQPIGNILFPKISKTRLLTGRLIAVLVMNYFYFSSILVIYGLNGQIPLELYYSLIYAGIYSILVLTFIIFLSSNMKSSNVVTILSLFAIILIFPIFEVLFVILWPDFEPVFLLTYYARPITGVFTGTSGGNVFDIVNTDTGESLLRFVKSPSPLIVFFGVSILSSLFIFLSYVQYERRQNH
ncbi:MAG: hypothetical protein ACW991_05725 [Candidatus Hodarchaeales archaeon]